MRLRSSRDMRGHGPLSKASRATAIAWRMSSSVACGAAPIDSSVAGFGIEYERPSLAPTHFPPTYIL